MIPIGWFTPWMIRLLRSYLADITISHLAPAVHNGTMKARGVMLTTLNTKPLLITPLDKINVATE
jgi:hypothetical protein